MKYKYATRCEFDQLSLSLFYIKSATFFKMLFLTRHVHS